MEYYPVVTDIIELLDRMALNTTSTTHVRIDRLTAIVTRCSELREYIATTHDAPIRSTFWVTPDQLQDFEAARWMRIEFNQERGKWLVESFDLPGPAPRPAPAAPEGPADA